MSHHEKQISIDLCGIINGPLKIKTCKTGSTNQRFPIILPDNTQCLVEIWTPKNCAMPELNENWKSLQMVIITGLYFAGYLLINGKRVKVLRLPLYGAKRNRLIWLSGKNFWTCPVEVNKQNFGSLLESNWPHSINFEGYLVESEGSVITKSWRAIYSKIHSTDIEPFSLNDLQLFHSKIRKALQKFVNFYTEKIADPVLLFER